MTEPMDKLTNSRRVAYAKVLHYRTILTLKEISPIANALVEADPATALLAEAAEVLKNARRELVSGDSIDPIERIDALLLKIEGAK